jgi:hypothetical protein
MSINRTTLILMEIIVSVASYAAYKGISEKSCFDYKELTI